MFIHTRVDLIINYLRDVISIKIIDYIADSMNVPEIASGESEVTVINNTVVRVNNFVSIGEYNDDKISVDMTKGRICIVGDKLNISMINDRYLQITGKISSISFGVMD